MATKGEDYEIISPPNQSSPIWKYFGYQTDHHGKIIKSDRVICKVCKFRPAHGGGTSNMMNHLLVHHPTLYYKLYPDKLVDVQGKGKQATMDAFVQSTSKQVLPSTSNQAKNLTDAIVEFII